MNHKHPSHILATEAGQGPGQARGFYTLTLINPQQATKLQCSIGAALAVIKGRVWAC